MKFAHELHVVGPSLSFILIGFKNFQEMTATFLARIILGEKIEKLVQFAPFDSGVFIGTICTY
jgi:hypothetical protein